MHCQVFKKKLQSQQNQPQAEIVSEPHSGIADILKLSDGEFKHL